MTEKEINIRPIFPNAVTMTALAFGVSSINMAFWGYWQLAVIFIALSAVFDFFDGKVARMLNVSSRFGAELDSLSDFVSFGVAPAFLMYLWTMDASIRINVLQNLAGRSDAIGIYWAVVLFVAMCCAARLARFNSLIDQEQPSYWKYFFMGVPAPAGAYLTILPLIFWLATKQQIEFFRDPVFVSVFLVFSGVMMASKIPTLCLKHLHISSKYATVLLILALIVLAGLVASTWIMLSIIGVLYLISIPVCIFYFIRLKKEHKDV
ncbi:MAG: phosphatidylcholine/phosphatidylserine synthase [Alphaproteobacteria bacterium]|nr:phosphatidylcholine/phosphatidylserine synthase [Alphaproteobacteria bacterium]MBQ9089637.1 phosphatidylcholine/phosphatidylserine synthase [Alphaproteobacteria bacterium]